jgi:hypothetical protein
MKLVRMVALVSLAAALLAGSAIAKRAPTATEKAALTKAATAYVHAHSSPVAKDATIAHVWVSTVNSQYARVDTSSKTVGPGVMLLRLKGTTWKPFEFGTGGFFCGEAPKGVMKDLLGGCIPGKPH